MKKILVILASIYLIGCDSRQFESTDPLFDHYLIDFKNEYKSFKNKDIDFDVTVNFSDVGKKNAECRIYFDDKNEILVNKKVWERIKETSKKSLIFHELGHCVLKQKEHRNERIKTKVSTAMPVSIMNNTSFGTLSEDQERNEFYLYELFNNDKSVWELFL